MGLFNLFRKPKVSIVKPDPIAAEALFNSVSSNVLGEPIALGTKLITSTILQGRAANYNLVRTPEAFRLGVINCFAFTASLFPAKKILGVIITSDKTSTDSYRNDHYGTNEVPVQEYLSAFKIDMMPEGILSIRRTDGYGYIDKNKNKMLYITNDNSIVNNLKIYQGIVIITPIIKDDGKEARDIFKS
jgi:hypothetical protein